MIKRKEIVETYYVQLILACFSIMLILWGVGTIYIFSYSKPGPFIICYGAVMLVFVIVSLVIPDKSRKPRY